MAAESFRQRVACRDEPDSSSLPQPSSVVQPRGALTRCLQPAAAFRKYRQKKTLPRPHSLTPSPNKLTRLVTFLADQLWIDLCVASVFCSVGVLKVALRTRAVFQNGWWSTLAKHFPPRESVVGLHRLLNTKKYFFFKDIPKHHCIISPRYGSKSEDRAASAS